MSPESNLDRLIIFQNEAINEAERAMHRVHTIEKLIDQSLEKAGITRPEEPTVNESDPFEPRIIYGGKHDPRDHRTPDIA